MSTVFETLNKINVSEHTEKKGQLTYLSWAWAYQAVKEKYPLMQYKTYENDLGFNYHTDGNTCWVKVSTTIEELEHIEYLPVMDFKNKSIPKANVTSMDVNNAIQRGLTKSLARHGLGLYIYAGEDLPTQATPTLANDDQIKEITSLLKSTQSDMVKFLQVFKVKTVSEMTNDVAIQAIKTLHLKEKKMKESK